jgi:poly-gamma-glutamate system protein
MRSPGPSAGRPYWRVYAAAAASLAYLLLLRLPPVVDLAGRAEMARASAGMARAAAALRDCRAARGVPVDPAADPNGTGLIGVERSVTTTSLGSLEAKRTTTNPGFAALMVRLLRDAGVRRGDVVGVGASSSFPALIVATLAAAEVMGVEPLVISSLGASDWGANIPGFGWLDMEECLSREGLAGSVPIARSLGGEGDLGLDMDPEGRALIASRVRAGSVPFIDEPSLEGNVAARMARYRERPPALKAFIHIGGPTWHRPEVLKIEPGLTRGIFIPPLDRRGVIQAMAAAGVPVIHLLNIKGLCERYGLPWDPRPLPPPGQVPAFRLAAARSWPSTALTAAYVLAVAVLIFGIRRRLI